LLACQYDLANWAAARDRADQALKGHVFAPVGYAKHYHTDWVFPWWRPKLHKTALIETLLFLRWPITGSFLGRGFWPHLSSSVTMIWPKPSAAQYPLSVS
jgi:hypothetical protein